MTTKDPNPHLCHRPPPTLSHWSPPGGRRDELGWAIPFTFAGQETRPRAALRPPGPPAAPRTPPTASCPSPGPGSAQARGDVTSVATAARCLSLPRLGQRVLLCALLTTFHIPTEAALPRGGNSHFPSAWKSPSTLSSSSFRRYFLGASHALSSAPATSHRGDKSQTRSRAWRFLSPGPTGTRTREMRNFLQHRPSSSHPEGPRAA